MGRAEGGPAATVEVPRRRSVWGVHFNQLVPAYLRLWGCESGVSTAVCVSLSPADNFSPSAIISLFSISVSLFLSVHLSHLLLSFSVFCLFVSAYVSLFSPSFSPLLPCLCFSLYVSCAYLTVCPSSSFSVLLTPQPLQQDPERSGPPSLTRQTLLVVPGRADPGRAALHPSTLG